MRKMSRSSKASSIPVLITLLWLCSTVQPNEGLRILGIIPFHMRSQFVMSEELFKALAAKGHRVDVYGHFPLKKPIPNYNDFSLQGSLPVLTNNLSYDDATSTTDVIKLMDAWYTELCGSMCDLLGLPQLQKLIHDPPIDPPYDLVVVEFSIVHCFIPFGRHLNVPVIAVQALSLYPWQYNGFRNPVNLASEPSFLTNYVNPMSFIERLNNFIMHYRAIYFFEGHVRSQDRYVEKYFGPGYPTSAELQKDIALIFVTENTAVFGAKAFMPKVIPVAGLHIVDRNETLSKDVQKWLDDSTSGCVLFTFGSMIRIETLPSHVLDVFYKAFKNIAPVRVLLKIAKPEVLPPGLPANVFTQTWFQQGAVLRHKNIRAFVTHGGLMGTQESIYHEVPMIGIPIFFDQDFTINNYVSKKMAIKLPLSELTEATFTNALREILTNPTYKEHVVRVSRQYKDRPMNVMDTAVFWVEYIHRHGKDALKAASEDMPWWQASLLDVYAFLITLTILAVFTCVQLFKVMINALGLSSSKVNANRIKKSN